MRKLLLMLFFFLSLCSIYHEEIALVTAEGYGSSRELYLAEDGENSTGFGSVRRLGGGRGVGRASSGGGMGGRSSPRFGGTRQNGAHRIPYSGQNGSNGNGGSHNSRGSYGQIGGRVRAVISALVFLYGWF